MVGLKDYENEWYSREATSLRNNSKWRHGRKLLFDLNYRLNEMDLNKRKHCEINLHNYVRPTDFVKTQNLYQERRNWNRKFPNWLPFRELHMYCDSIDIIKLKLNFCRANKKGIMNCCYGK